VLFERIIRPGCKGPRGLSPVHLKSTPSLPALLAKASFASALIPTLDPG
jgi:hypothetical protein